MKVNELISELLTLDQEKEIYSIRNVSFSNPELKTDPKYYII